ncbi:MAG: magnesium and cobalt transporter [Alphaproteobacteria bacterium]|jgi:magnesium and cobalt transporter
MTHDESTNTEEPKLFSRITNIFKSRDNDYREAIEDLISAKDAGPSDGEHQMLLNVLALGTLRIDDIMVPRADILAVSEDTSLEEVLEIFKSSQHSRLPVYRETLDDPVGFVHIKDAVALHLEIRSGNQLDKTLLDIIRNVLYTPDSVSVRELLLRMQSGNVHMALVIDEYGGTDGIVTIEDLIECVIGKINDEHDLIDVNMFQEKSAGIYEVDARLELEDLYQSTNLKLSDEIIDYNVDTIGGFVTALIGRVPQRGEIIEYHKDCEFHIIDADPKKIKRLRIVRQKSNNSLKVVS